MPSFLLISLFRIGLSIPLLRSRDRLWNLHVVIERNLELSLSTLTLIHASKHVFRRSSSGILFPCFSSVCLYNRPLELCIK